MFLASLCVSEYYSGLHLWPMSLSLIFKLDEVSLNMLCSDGTAPDNTENPPFIYIYTSAGIVAFVVLVIVVSVFWMRGCRGGLFLLLSN